MQSVTIFLLYLLPVDRSLYKINRLLIMSIYMLLAIISLHDIFVI